MGPRLLPEFRGIRKTFSSASQKTTLSVDGPGVRDKEPRRKPPAKTFSGCSTRSTGTNCTTKSCRSTRSFISTTQTTQATSTVTQSTLSDEDAEWIVQRTETKIGQTVANSRFMQKNCKLSRIPRFTHDELIIGEMIAQGGFSEVRTVTFLDDEESDEDSSAKLQLRSELDNQGRPKQYVIKHLSPKLVSKPKMLAVGAKDIVLEGFLLSSLDHENILKLKGHAAAGIQGLRDTGRADGYFLILPRLSKTLHTHLRDWAAEIKRRQPNQPKAVMSEQLNASVSSLGVDSVDSAAENDASATSEPRQDISVEESETPSATVASEDLLKSFQQEPFIFERLQTAVEIARAMWYLHDQRIIYRDLKPANVGYDPDTHQVKIFDFGLAVELPATKDPNQVYPLPGNTGTARYMAPEVIRSEPYNTKADVFSFSVLLWEIMSLVKPFEKLPGKDVKEQVAVFCERPHIPRAWPAPLRNALRRGWSDLLEVRPNMEEMHDVLTDLMEE